MAPNTARREDNMASVAGLEGNSPGGPLNSVKEGSEETETLKAWRLKVHENEFPEVVIDDLDRADAGSSFLGEKSGESEEKEAAGGILSRARNLCWVVFWGIATTCIGAVFWYFKRMWKGACVVFNLHAILICCIACASVFLCGPDYLDLAWDTNFSIISLGSVFPVVYTINQAFNRREKAAEIIAELKATCVSIYWMHRDWDRHSLDEKWTGSTCQDNVFQVIKEYLCNVRHFIKTRMGQHGDTRTAAMYLQRCYLCLSSLSFLNERLSENAGYSKGGEGGMSRAQQYLRFCSSHLENLRIVREYRTPRGLRYASQFLIHTCPVLLAPYFRWFTLPRSGGHEAAGYFAAIVYCLVQCTLLHIQEDMEDPFDLIGMDDLTFSVPEEVGAVYMTERFRFDSKGRILIDYKDPLPENSEFLSQLVTAKEASRHNGSGSREKVRASLERRISAVGQGLEFEGFAGGVGDAAAEEAWKVAVSLCAPSEEAKNTKVTKHTFVSDILNAGESIRRLVASPGHLKAKRLSELV